MTKQQKVWLGLGALVVVAVALFAFKPKAAAAPAEEKPTDGPSDGINPCPPGEMKCASSDKCYDPNANYLVDPCQ